MKKLRKFLIGLLIVIAILLIGALLFVRYIGHRGLPDYSGTIDLEGVKEEVRIVRDEFAIPHIYAKNENDLYIAVGYVLAQDRLWQMDLLRRVTQGRLSEIFGKDYVETDVLLRALRYTEKSQRILSTMDSSQIKCLQAFASGMNQYIQKQGKNLPPEFAILGYKPELWEPLHSLNLIGYMAWDLKAGWSEMILDQVRAKVGDSLYAELLPELGKEKTAVYPLYKRDSLPVSLGKSLLSQTAVLEKLGLDIFQGSNNWAVSGSRSASGKPILANDMHLSLNVPGIWYQMHQVVEGKLDVSGLVLPGQPLVVCGHNERIAWGMTNTTVDNVDFYEEKINPSNLNQYEYMGEWKDMQVKKEVIKVKGGKSFEREIRFTHRGPIVSGFKKIKEKVISMHWVGDEYSNELRSVYLVNRAGNWDQFRDAMKTFLAVSQNVVYADVDGNIGLYCCAGVPIRKREGIQFFLPGWTDEYDWKGMLPFDTLPHSYNPPTGYVSSANNKTVGDDYPFHIGTWYPLPYRIDRIRELIEATAKHSPESFKAIQTDHVSVLARQMTPGIIQYLGSFANLNADEHLALDLLKGWNYSMDKDLVAPSLFEKFYIELAKSIMSDEMGADLYSTYEKYFDLARFAVNNIWQDPASAWCDDVTTLDKKEGLADMVRISMDSTLVFLKQKYGNDTLHWKWGNLHTFTLAHPLGKVKILDVLFGLNRGPYHVSGASHTVEPYSEKETNTFAANHGASQRHIFTLENWDNSQTVIPTGNSGIPASKNYCDQSELYIGNQYHGEYFSEEKVKEHAKYTMTIR